jgi:hypothetical protein
MCVYERLDRGMMFVCAQGFNDPGNKEKVAWVQTNEA